MTNLLSGMSVGPSVRRLLSEFVLVSFICVSNVFCGLNTTIRGKGEVTNNLSIY